MKVFTLTGLIALVLSTQVFAQEQGTQTKENAITPREACIRDVHSKILKNVASTLSDNNYQIRFVKGSTGQDKLGLTEFESGSKVVLGEQVPTLFVAENFIFRTTIHVAKNGKEQDLVTRYQIDAMTHYQGGKDGPIDSVSASAWSRPRLEDSTLNRVHDFFVLSGKPYVISIFDPATKELVLNIKLNPFGNGMCSFSEARGFWQPLDLSVHQTQDSPEDSQQAASAGRAE